MKSAHSTLLKASCFLFSISTAWGNLNFTESFFNTSLVSTPSGNVTVGTDAFNTWYESNATIDASAGNPGEALLMVPNNSAVYYIIDATSMTETISLSASLTTTGM